jgi:hypothetical protein
MSVGFDLVQWSIWSKFFRLHTPKIEERNKVMYNLGNESTQLRDSRPLEEKYTKSPCS